MKIIRQIIRGCGTLPHVGEHPGTAFLFVFVLMGAAAGASHGGWRGAIGGALFMGACMAPPYLYGAYDRAQVSDRIEGEMSEHKIQDYIVKAMSDALEKPQAREEHARAMVADLDAMLRQHGGSATFGGTHGDEVYYTMLLPPGLSAMTHHWDDE